MAESSIGNFFENITVLRVLAGFMIFVFTWGALAGLKFAAELLAARYGRYRLFISSSFPILRLFAWVSALLFVVFVIFKPPFNTLVAISASVGLAVGLGAQDLIKNLIAGILLLIDRPFRAGDMIDVSGHYGEVVNIGLRSTQILTFDDSTVTLPNSMVLNGAVSNSNSGELDEMVVVDLALPAHVDVMQVKALAQEAAACSPYVYLKKPISVTVADDFRYTFLTTFKIKAYVLDIRRERRLASDIVERLKRELIARGLVTAQMFPATSGQGG